MYILVTFENKIARFKKTEEISHTNTYTQKYIYTKIHTHIHLHIYTVYYAIYIYIYIYIYTEMRGWNDAGQLRISAVRRCDTWGDTRDLGALVEYRALRRPTLT